MTLRFTPGNHRYTLDGRWIPSVTGVTGAGLPKPALLQWHADVVADFVADEPTIVAELRETGGLRSFLKALPKSARDKAALRGTEIHSYAEMVVGGENALVPDRLVRHVEGLARLIDRLELRPVITETPVASRKHWYAGKPDFIGTKRGVPVCVDWKTSNSVYGDTSLQTGAYGRAEFYATQDDPDTEYPLPPVEEIAVVHITEDGSWLYNLGSVDDAFADFLAVQRVSQTMRRIKDLIGEPE